MKNWTPELSDDEKRTARGACDKIRKQYGSFVDISYALHLVTGVYINKDSVWMWFRDVEIKTIPIFWAAALSDLIEDIELADFYPWLTRYFERHYD